MAVVDAEKMWSESRAPISKDGRSAVLAWSVILDGTDTVAQAPITARRATGIPRLDDTHPNDAGLKVVDVDPQPMKSPIYWKVVVTYAAKDTAGDADSPLDAPAVHSWGNSSTIEPVEDDPDGKPIVNAAGDAFDPPLQREFRDTVLTISRNEASYNNPLISSIIDTTNAKILTLGGHKIGRGIARMNNITANEVFDGNDSYFAFAYEIHFRRPNKERGLVGEKTWYRRIMNAGFQELTLPPMVAIQRIKDAEGNFITEPAPLTLNGRAVAPDANGIRVPNWLLFKQFPEADWTKLGLS